MNKLTPEEEEYADKIVAHIVEVLSDTDMNMVCIQGLLSALSMTTFRAFVYTCIAQGYILRDEELMTEKHKFSINDFLEKK